MKTRSIHITAESTAAAASGRSYADARTSYGKRLASIQGHPTEIESTRGGKPGNDLDGDRFRDMSGFDVDEELRRFRDAVIRGQAEIAMRLAANLDEWVSRNGPLPEEWLGQKCCPKRRASMKSACAVRN